MDLAHYAVQAVLVEGRSVRDVAAATGRSKSWVQRHCALYRSRGEAALVPHKRGPKAPPNQTSAVVEDVILTLRKELAELGLDADDYTTVDAVVALLVDHPELMQRPVVRSGRRAVIARPPERAAEFLGL